SGAEKSDLQCDWAKIFAECCKNLTGLKNAAPRHAGTALFPPSVATHQNKLCPGQFWHVWSICPYNMRLIAARSACPGCDQTLRAPVGARVRAVQRTNG